MWHDEDLIEVRVTATNGVFSGAACIYVALDALHAAADVLSGFPSGPSDRRRIEWGGAGLGSAVLEFVVTDGLCHCQVIVDVRTGDQCRDVPGQSATVLLPVEPAAIDRFVTKLRQAGMDRQEAAVLEGTA